MWTNYFWWDHYWYNGGGWFRGKRPSYYYYGPFVDPVDRIVIQVEQEPIIQEVAPSAAVGEAIAEPAYDDGPLLPVHVPQMNRAAEYYLTLGDRAFQTGRYTDAVHHYSKAVEYSPKEGILYLILSDALFATGDYHYGAFALRKALELDPELVELASNKRSYYGVPSDLDLHMTRARTFVKSHPTDEDARLMLIANEIFMGESGRAMVLIDQQRETPSEPSAAELLLKEKALQGTQKPSPAQTRDASVIDAPESGSPVFVVDPPK